LQYNFDVPFLGQVYDIQSHLLVWREFRRIEISHNSHLATNQLFIGANLYEATSPNTMNSLLQQVDHYLNEHILVNKDELRG